jgi:pimeloyl-ACP methyl ester carboxylesterase
VNWSHTGRKYRFAAAALAVVGIALTLVPVPARAAEASCEDLFFPVSVLGMPHTMYGRLCTPAGGANTVQVLIPGASYRGVYWDIELTPQIRSFRRAMNDAGYATLTVDRLGTGQSSAPPSVVVTAITQAGAVHQVVTALRSGELGPGFDKVIVGGHSLGSAISVIEAATYHDVDGVLVTGMTHHLNLLGTAPIAATLAPAVLDPAFVGRVSDPGYLTTLPGTRFASFHSPGTYNAAVAQHEEATKDVVAATEVADAALFGSVAPYSILIDVPVLTVVASRDPVVCGLLATNCGSSSTLLQAELPFYAPAAHLRAYLLNGYGHALNYAPNAPTYHDVVVQWADGMVGK